MRKAANVIINIKHATITYIYNIFDMYFDRNIIPQIIVKVTSH